MDEVLCSNSITVSERYFSPLKILTCKQRYSDNNILRRPQPQDLGLTQSHVTGQYFPVRGRAAGFQKF